MFAEAYKLVNSFVRPVIISRRLFDGTVKCGCGAYVVVNEEGWIITVAHLWETASEFVQHTKERAEYDARVKAIKEQKIDAKQKTKKLHRLVANPKWITNHSFWWSLDGVQLKDVKVLAEGDLAVGRLEPFDPKACTAYPVLKDPSNLSPGTSLCKIGYPFHDIQATFDEAGGGFVLAQGVLPLPRFPMEGIFTRNVLAGKSRDGKYEVKFLETSTPGLMGQSGGPIFDVNGTVWGIQSRTAHLALGFSPKVKKNGREVEENQFLNVGLGVHPELIVAFMRENGIKFAVSEY